MSTESKNSPSIDSDSENQSSNAFNAGQAISNSFARKHAIKKDELYQSRGNYSRHINDLIRYKNSIPSAILNAQSGERHFNEKERHRRNIKWRKKDIKNAEKDMIKKYRNLRHFEKDTQKSGLFPQMTRITHTPYKGKGTKYMHDEGGMYPLLKKIPKQIGGKKKRKTRRKKRKTHRRKRKTRRRKTHRRKTHRRKRKSRQRKTRK